MFYLRVLVRRYEFREEEDGISGMQAIGRLNIISGTE